MLRGVCMFERRTQQAKSQALADKSKLLARPPTCGLHSTSSNTPASSMSDELQPAQRTCVRTPGEAVSCATSLWSLLCDGSCYSECQISRAAVRTASTVRLLWDALACCVLRCESTSL
eukprot:13252-Heterococcus_DN1.PRE.1